MKIFFFCLGIFVLSLLFAPIVTAQITIGKAAVASKGTLLDLTNLDNEPNSMVNANKGLGMPRVGLQKIDKLYPMLPQSYDVGENQKHVGLMVYNAGNLPCEPIYAGLHVWNGSEWEMLFDVDISVEGIVFEGRDQSGNKFLYRKFGTAGYWMTTNLAARQYADNMTVTPEQMLSANPTIPPEREYTIPHWSYPSISGETADHLLPTLYNQDPYVGLLYSWSAASAMDGLFNASEANAEHERRQGICPEGWHLPSDKEWNELEAVIYNNPELSSGEKAANYTPAVWDPAFNNVIDQNYPRGNTKDEAKQGHGMAMRSPCPTISTKPGAIAGTSHFKPKPLGLNIMLIGLRHQDGNSRNTYGNVAMLWTSSRLGYRLVIDRAFYAESTKVRRFNDSSAHQMSVRCKMNAEAEPTI